MRTMTVDDLYRVEGKAVLVNGEIIQFSPMGAMPGYSADEILFSLWQYVKRTGRGQAMGDNKVFVVTNLPNRQAFSPNTAYYTGSRTGMKFFQGPPDFVVEVRSENDYGLKAAEKRKSKRADYFADGTLVVWDVDLQSVEVVRKYTVANQETPTIFRRGEIADAEPAVPDWTLPVDDLFG